LEIDDCVDRFTDVPGEQRRRIVVSGNLVNRFTDCFPSCQVNWILRLTASVDYISQMQNYVARCLRDFGGGPFPLTAGVRLIAVAEVCIGYHNKRKTREFLPVRL
jgi:hypothetical protein